MGAVIFHPSHIHPAADVFRFRFPKCGIIDVCDEDGYSIGHVNVEYMAYLPAYAFKLYTRWGIVAKLITNLSAREIHAAIKSECANQGCFDDPLPSFSEYLSPNPAILNSPRTETYVGSGPSPSRIRREMRMAIAPGSHTHQEWRSVMLRDGWKCLRCGNDKTLSKDHVVPISRGGTNSVENLQTLCVRCNSWKGARTMDFRAPICSESVVDPVKQ